MKRKCIMILLIALTIIGYENAETSKQNKEKDEEIVINSFKSSNAQFKSFNTNYSGLINNEFLTLKELEDLSEDFIKDLDFKESYREEVEESKMSKLSIYGQVDGGKNITLVLYSYKTLENNKNQTSIFLDLKTDEDCENIEDITSKISKILEEQKIKLKTNTCIIGAYEGQLESEYKLAIVKKIINLSNARQIETLVNDDFLSYSLYTDNIEDYIYTGRNKINLNIAIRYDEYRDQTNIFLASPIITMGY